MPELPEVETVRTALAEILPGQRLTQIQAFRKDLRFPIPSRKFSKIKGLSLRGIRRRAKYLLFDFEDQVFLSHLGMTGNWRIGNMDPKKHDHLMLQFADLKLIYNDPRRFGFVDIFSSADESKHPRLVHLGIEPLSDEFTGEYLKQKAGTRASNVKTFLMNNEVVVGVGNIYAVESLFRSGIHPLQSVSDISTKKWQRLTESIKQVLDEAIHAGGSSIKDFRSSTGETGYFQDKFKVYGRAGLPCYQCGKALIHQNISGRATVWCGKCQK